MTPDVAQGRHPFAGRRIVLGVTGGIAAYKSILVARELTQAGAEVDVVMSAGAEEFLRPLSFEALTGRPVYAAMHVEGEPLLHIRLAREADVIVVAPATANFMARAAAGMADDLLTAVLLATPAPVLICPAMNDRMFAHPRTQANLATLSEAGYSIAGPAAGPLAWGEGEGLGRMLEPSDIVAHIGRELEPASSLAGRRVVVTGGPTHEPIDPVRYIGNRSSGRMGYAIAAAAWRRGAEVILISGPSALPSPVGVEIVQVETAIEMHDAVADALPEADALVMAAAVADFRPGSAAGQKIKKDGSSVPEVRLERNPDILRETRAQRPENCVVVGFALETERAEEHGAAKLRDKGLDFIVVNDATEAGAGFAVDTNRVTIIDRDGSIDALPLLTKDQVADEILNRVAAYLDETAV